MAILSRSILAATAVAVAITTMPTSAMQPREMSKRQFRDCLDYTIEIDLLDRTIPQSINRYNRMLDQIDGMDDGPSRRTLIRSSRTLRASIEEEQWEHQGYIDRFNNQCLDTDITYEVFKDGCDDRRTMRQNNFCTYPNLRILADELRRERGWK